MKKYLLPLAALSAGISCTTYAMHQQQLNPHSQTYQPSISSQLDTCNPHGYFFSQPQLWPQSTHSLSLTKEERKTRKLMLAENKLGHKQAQLCTQLLQTYNGAPVINTTEETRNNVAIFLQAWSENLQINGYSMSQWRQHYESSGKK